VIIIGVACHASEYICSGNAANAGPFPVIVGDTECVIESDEIDVLLATVIDIATNDE